MVFHGADDASRIRVVGPRNEDYPAWLARIYAPPPALWVRGRLVAGEGERAVAIVGSRAATRTGLAFAHLLAADLAAAGLTIVSGLARGIDTAAHQGTLDAGGRTVAVLGCGVDRVYPAENAGLARAIAGWARVVIVVEAGEKSGALLTARAALDEGRDVMAVPGHPTLPSAAGTNALLRDGAALVRDAGDVLSELGLASLAASPPADRREPPLLAAFVRGVPTTVEEIAARSALPVPDLLARLSELELAGRLRRLPGAVFVRS